MHGDDLESDADVFFLEVNRRLNRITLVHGIYIPKDLIIIIKIWEKSWRRNEQNSTKAESHVFPGIHESKLPWISVTAYKVTIYESVGNNYQHGIISAAFLVAIIRSGLFAR